MFLSVLLLVVAIIISAVAAYYSIAGLITIFAAAVIPVIIMASVLEFAKVLTAAWLSHNWARTNFFLKSYLTFAVIVLMMITSLGIFGFLSKAVERPGRLKAPSKAFKRPLKDVKKAF